jgi:murein DD-endopeptidase MepM/ murein hydrolase activator NlpD
VSGNVLVAEIGPSGTVSDIEKENSNSQSSLYVVREGDTLQEIANMFDVTANTIIWANDIDKNSVLREGQKLVILPISGIRYTIKKGDTIRGIVSKHKTDLNEVLKYNDLTLASPISPGEIIIIPDAEPTIDNSKTSSFMKSNSLPLSRESRLPYYPGYFIRPIEGGYRSQGLHGTNAVDLAVSLGTPIRASAAGTVIVSKTGGWHGGYGNYVIISHPNGTQTLYAHTQKNFVSVGDSVEQGQLIARVGNTGNSTGPHVHFEIRGAKNPF